MGAGLKDVVQHGREPVVLVGASVPGEHERHEHHMAELRRLVDTSGGVVVGEVTQHLKRIHPATYIGPGKLEELARVVKAADVLTVVFDEDLSPAQQRNLAKALGDRQTKIKVLDRTHIILDIFAQRARTREGVLQVELAQLEYRLPRLGGLGEVLTQQVGRIGTRGPGEKMLEVDRRHIQRRIDRLKRDIAGIQRERATQRKRRQSVPCPQIALVGYTNAGKSTLLNTLMRSPRAKRVYADDKLFATLDPTTRKVSLPSGGWTLATDTVGFIEKLPHQLVAAFRATLEEVLQADCLIHVMDATSEELAAQRDAVQRILADIGAADIPVVEALNKVDGMTRLHQLALQNRTPAATLISAREDFGLDVLLRRVERVLARRWKPATLRLPVARSDRAAELHRVAQVLERRVDGEEMVFEVRITTENLERFQALSRRG